MKAQPMFESVYIALAHIKAIRIFAESVLRFGVPANFTAAILDFEGSSRNQKASEQALGKLYKDLDILGIQDNTSAPSQAEQNLLGKEQQTFYPYVYLSISCMDDDD